MNQLHALADTLQDLSRWNAFRLRLFFEGIVEVLPEALPSVPLSGHWMSRQKSGDIFFPHILNQPYLMAM